MRLDIARRTGSLSTPMTSEAPISLAPAVAHRPIGPWAKTTTESPIFTPPDSGPLKPVEAMSARSTTCSSVTSSGMRVRFAWADGTRRYSACAPLIVLPKRQPPRASKPSPWPHWLRLPDRQARHWPHGVIAPTSTRWPTS